MTDANQRRSRWVRRCIDVLASAAAIYAMVAITPVGGLFRSAARKLTGGRVASRSLASYFSTAGQGAGRQQLVLQLRGDGPSWMASARDAGVDARFARALVVALSKGKRDEAGAPVLAISAEGRRSLEAVGIAPAKRLAVAGLIDGVGSLTKRLGGEEAATAALTVELYQVEYATQRARAAGSKRPAELSAFGPFLPPDQRERAEQLSSGVFALTTALDMVYPLAAQARVTSKFGYRRHPVLKTRRLHTGIDLAVPTGTGIRAVASGRVVYATEDSVNGKFIKLDHGHGLTSAYCHASRLQVERGDRVARGDGIALSGSTGRSTGPHLHFQLELGGEAVDPELFITMTDEPRRAAGPGAKAPAVRAILSQGDEGVRLCTLGIDKGKRASRVMDARHYGFADRARRGTSPGRARSPLSAFRPALRVRRRRLHQRQSHARRLSVRRGDRRVPGRDGLSDTARRAVRGQEQRLVRLRHVHRDEGAGRQLPGR